MSQMTRYSQGNAEIKTWKECKNALGQLTAYQDDCHKEELHVYLFGSYDESWKKKAIKTFTNKGIQCYEFTETMGEDGKRYVSIVQASDLHKVFIQCLDC